MRHLHPRRTVSALAVATTLALLPVSPAGAARTPEATRADGCRPLPRRQQVAQLVVSAIHGTRARPNLAVVERHAGSVVLFDANIRSRAQLRRLTRRLRSAAPARLLVAVDEEGGRVARLGSAGLVTHLPSARTMAATRTPRQVRRLGAHLGRELRELGVNWNLGPVLDVAGAARYTVIGDRGYSGRPRVVAEYASAFARGLRLGGVRTTGKHFPGHGPTTTDSHVRLPVVDATYRQLWRRDLLPYRRALPHLDAVMTAHVLYRSIDRRRPASLSPAVTRLLRRDLGYGGVLVTDALEMGAVAGRHTVPHAAELAIRAGADMVLLSRPGQARAVTGRLLDAVRQHRIPQRRLRSAVQRVLALKGYGPVRAACLSGDPLPSTPPGRPVPLPE